MKSLNGWRSLHERQRAVAAQKSNPQPTFPNFAYLIRANDIVEELSQGKALLRQFVQSSSHPDAFLEYCSFIEGEGFEIHACTYAAGEKNHRAAAWEIEVVGKSDALKALHQRFEDHRNSGRKRLFPAGRDATVGVFAAQLVDVRYTRKRAKREVTEYLTAVRHIDDTGPLGSLNAERCRLEPTTGRAVVTKFRTYRLPGGGRVIEARIATLTERCIRKVRAALQKIAKHHAFVAGPGRRTPSPSRTSIKFWRIKNQKALWVQFPSTASYLLN